MKEKFEDAVVEIIEFEAADVIGDSCPPDSYVCEWDTGFEA